MKLNQISGVMFIAVAAFLLLVYWFSPEPVDPTEDYYQLSVPGFVIAFYLGIVSVFWNKLKKHFQ